MEFYLTLFLTVQTGILFIATGGALFDKSNEPQDRVSKVMIPLWFLFSCLAMYDAYILWASLVSN